MRLALALIALCAVLPGAASASVGGKLFVKEGCSGCHTLIAAGATGKVGPDLSYVNPNSFQVTRKVLEGGGGMPSFRGKMSSAQIATLAYWVSWAANLAVLSVPQVKTIQRHLAKLGYFHQAPNGVYGPLTTAAVETFQRSAGISATGIWGSKTAAAVTHKLG